MREYIYVNKAMALLGHKYYCFKKNYRISYILFICIIYYKDRIFFTIQMLLSGIENKIETILLFIEGFICLILFNL